MKSRRQALTAFCIANENALDRTKISPNGTYYQHRETVNHEWKTIASSNVNGVMTKQVFSDDTLFISNQDMAQRRKEGYDIGNAYTSSAAKVYHFDTDIYDQNGVNDLTIEDAPDGSTWRRPRLHPPLYWQLRHIPQSAKHYTDNIALRRFTGRA